MKIGVGRAVFGNDDLCPIHKRLDSTMNIKMMLISSAAALSAISGAQAADAIVAAEPEAVEYVRVCDAYGTGYFYIPGTETCLKINGYIRFQVNGGPNAVTGGAFHLRRPTGMPLPAASFSSRPRATPNTVR
jgi:hypothetical protein